MLGVRWGGWGKVVEMDERLVLLASACCRSGTDDWWDVCRRAGEGDEMCGIGNWGRGRTDLFRISRMMSDVAKGYGKLV